MKTKSAETEERALIEAAQKQPSRFGALYERHFDQVYAYVARRAANRTEAEEVVSDVFYRALRSLNQFEWRGAPFVAWLLRIAANSLTDRRRQDLLERDTPEGGEAAETPTTEMDEAEESARLFRQVETLPEDQRRVVELRFAEEKSIEEIAAALGRSEGAVKQLQFRALRTLRTRMSKDDG